MKKQGDLVDRIIQCCGSELSKSKFDFKPYSQWLQPPQELTCISGVCAITGEHPHELEVENSSLQGSFLLGKCRIKDSVLYCSDLRGDELKCTTGKCAEEEAFLVRDSYLFKTLVHSNSHDKENPSEFFIRNSIAMNYSNIHGSPIEGCFLKPFATIDLTSAKNCAIGTYSYVQAGKLSERIIQDGCILISAKDFEFEYNFDPAVLQKYIRIESGGPGGVFLDLLDGLSSDYEQLFNQSDRIPVPTTSGSFCNPYALLKGKIEVSNNVFVSQRSYVKDSRLGAGSNVQENCCIIGSRLEGNDVSAHGSKMIHSTLGHDVFVGFNSFLRGSPDKRLMVGKGSIVAPHTIIDVESGIEIPPYHLAWGYIGSKDDLAAHSIPLDSLAGSTGEVKSGRMVFRGNGGAFVKGFQHRIEHILEGNGALCSAHGVRGHAQKYEKASFRALEPHREGELQGFFRSVI